MSAIICYWGEVKDVLWCELKDDDVFPKTDTLFTRMQMFICEGITTEILEYYPEAVPEGINDRCHWWHARLHEQGYEMRGKGG
jgi:hypothetical protein